EVDADREQRRACEGVDPVRPADLLSDLLRQRLVHERENGFGPGGGSSVTGRKSTTRPSLSCAMRRTCAWSCGSTLSISIKVAMSCTTPAESRCVTRL